MLEGPRQIAVLPRSAATTGRGRADIVAMHVSGAPESDGMHCWTNLRGDFQRYGSGDDYDGVTPAIAGGQHWPRGNAVFGGFAGTAPATTDFAPSGPNCSPSQPTPPPSPAPV